MKIKIGPFINWVGVYQLADMLQKVGVSEDRCDKIGDWLAKSDKLVDLCQWVYDKRPRKIKVHIDGYDTWNADSTLSYIIVPMLIQLRDTMHGYPIDFWTEDDRCSDQEIFEGEGFEFPEEIGFDQWTEKLNKMIWAFEQVNIEWEDQYYTGEVDWNFEKIEKVNDKGDQYSRMVHGPNHTFKVDHDGMRKHEAKMQEGFDLFGEYYRGLWD